MCSFTAGCFCSDSVHGQGSRGQCYAGRPVLIGDVPSSPTYLPSSRPLAFEHWDISSGGGEDIIFSYFLIYPFIHSTPTLGLA